MIARLQMSDLHLGDPRSVLSNPTVAASAVRQLASLSGGEVGKLVLAGDAVEECVPGDMAEMCEGLALSVHEAASNFFGALFREVKVDEVVWIPGNHDLSVWKWFADMTGGISAVTSYEGRPADASTWPWKLFLPGFAGKLTVAYPLYWDRSVGSDYPMLVTTHGHLLDPLVLGWESSAKYEFLSALGCKRPAVATESEKVGSLRAVAETTLDFILHMWRRYSPRDFTYANYVMRRLEHPQACAWQPAFPVDGYYQMDASMLSADAPPAGQGYQINLPWLLDVLVMDPYLPTPVGSLRQGEPHPAFERPSCVTFGHDHLGTFKTLVACGVPFACVDSGGWTSEWQGHLPHSHVLVWEHAEDVVPRSYFVRVRTSDGKIL